MEAELDKKSWSLVKILAIFRCQRNDIFSGTQVNSSKKIEVISLSSFLILGGGLLLLLLPACPTDICKY